MYFGYSNVLASNKSGHTLVWCNKASFVIIAYNSSVVVSNDLQVPKFKKAIILYSLRLQ